jgi:phytoene dehydrogenase-like protein
MARNNRYDIILIGSGMGALTVASLMAQLRGKRVLILERHFKAGGFTHVFKRQGYQWDPGLHYVGQMEEGSSPRNLFNLITGDRVQWKPMPEPFEKFVYPDFTFEVFGDPEQYKADLTQRFPEEESAIRQYFKDLSKGQAALFLYAAQQNAGLMFKLMAPLAKLWHGIDLGLTTQEYLDQHFQNPQLKALLASQWLDYGLPPEQSPFALHATIANHYLNGGYYPVGGSGTIASAVQKVVEAHGGEVLLNREVTEVLLDGGEAAGVRVRNLKAKDQAMEEYFAPVVVSNAGAYNTYLKFVPEWVPIPFRDQVKQFVQQHPPATNVSLYIGLSDAPRKLGFQGENYWIYETYDHAAVDRSKGTWIDQGQPLQMYLSFPSLKDPEATKPTAQVIAIADFTRFAPWNNQPWLHREADYQALKDRIQEILLNALEQHYPGFRAMVDYCELSTPITNQHFTDHPQGAIYGMPMVPERFAPENQPWTKVETPISGLYMTGSDIYMLGIVGTVMGGLLTTSRLPDGVSIPAAFMAAAKAKRTPSKPQAHPAHYKSS